MNIRFFFGLLSAAIAMPVLAVDAPIDQTDTASHRVYISDMGATELRQTLALRVDVPAEAVLPAEIDFSCALTAVGEYDGIVLTLTVQPTDGPVLYEGGLTLDVPKGETKAVLQWDTPADLADGQYAVRVEAKRENGTHMASTQLRLLKLSDNTVSNRVTRAQDLVTALNRHVAALGEDAFTPPVPQRLAVAREAASHANEAWRDSDWPMANDLAGEAIDEVEAIRAGLTFAMLAPERLAATPRVSPTTISIRGAALESGDAPVFLFGARMTLAEANHITDIAEFGINAAVLDISPTDVLPSPDAVLDLKQALTPILDECDRLGIAVALQLQPQKMAGWALDKWPDMARTQFEPFYYDITYPRALDVLEKFYRAVGAYVGAEPRIFAVSVADAPRFRISDEPMRQGFAAHLSQHYDSVVEMNLAWQSRLPSIEAIPIRWDWEKRAYQAHLQRYHRSQVTGFFSWIVNAFGPNPRNVPLTFTAPGSTFTIGSAKDGIDLESLDRTFAASVSGAAPDGPPGGYAIPFPGADMQIDLERSLNPGKPVFEFEANVGAPYGGPITRSKYPYRERARVWQAAMAGADLAATQFHQLFDEAEGGVVPHDTRALAGFITGGQTVNRLSAVVQRFQSETAPVALVWSDSSRILDNGSPYLASLRRAYEGVASFGLPVRFISERQMAAGDLANVSIVVLPEVLALADDAFAALDRYLEEGGRLVSAGSAIPYDAFGGSRPLRLRASPLTKLVRGAENAGDYLLALDAAFEASGLDEFPRAIDDCGYPMLGVVSRYLEDDDGHYLYVVNLKPEAEMVHLPIGRIGGRDLIDGRPVTFPLELQPLDPMLIALELPVASEPEVDSGEPTPGGTPTALVEPVDQDD